MTLINLFFNQKGESPPEFILTWQSYLIIHVLLSYICFVTGLLEQGMFGFLAIANQMTNFVALTHYPDELGATWFFAKFITYLHGNGVPSHIMIFIAHILLARAVTTRLLFIPIAVVNYLFVIMFVATPIQVTSV